MQATADAPERLPAVFVREGEAFANSRDLAEHFGKRHDHVVRDIKSLSSTAPKLGALNCFRQASYTDSKGERRICFEMTRDGFMLLAMGFTGQKALEWKMLYIEAFNRMEAELKAKAPVALALTEEARQVFGGIVKAVVGKALADRDKAFEDLAEQVRTLVIEADPRSVAVEYRPMLDVLTEHGVPPKGRRALSQRCSRRMARWCIQAENSRGMRISRETKRYLFHVDAVREWLAAEGNTLIAQHRAALAGQGVLPFKRRKDRSEGRN